MSNQPHSGPLHKCSTSCYRPLQYIDPPRCLLLQYMTQMALALRELQSALAAVAVGEHTLALEGGRAGHTGHHLHHHHKDRHGQPAAHSSGPQAADVAGVVELGITQAAAAGGDDSVGDVEAPAGADQTRKQQQQQQDQRVDKDPPPQQQQQGVAAWGGTAAGGGPAGPCLSTCRALLAGAEAALPAAQKEKYVGDCGGTR
jgi:hypothetical protein